MAEDQQKNEETTDAVIPDTAEAATPTPETPDAEPAPAEAPAAEAPAPEATAEAPEAEAPTETPEGEATDDEPPATQVEAMLSQKDETLEPATLETDDDEQGGGEPAPGGDGEAVEPDAEVSILEAAFENLAEDIEIPSARQAGVVPDAPPVELTSVVSGTALSQKTATVGYTGEILGKVVKLEDLAAADAEESEVDSSSYNQLRALIETTLTEVSENEIVQGRVVSVGEKDVVIDIGFKSDGVVSKNEFGAELNPGDEVEVYLEYLEDWHGQLVLSKTKADTVQRWQRIEQIFENEEVVEGTIIRRIKGGMIAELFDGVEAFLPGSQIDVRPVRDFDAYLSKRMQFKIVKLNPANENIVVSHKALVEKELQAQRESILSTMEAGQVLEGTVKNITDFGVFIDLGGVDGLLHITDLSWGRVSHPSELVELDEKMNVVVLDYDKERQRISLGLKQLQPHPWDNIADKFSEDDTVEGKVVSITDYGAFVELEKGIEGLVHISEMSWTEHIKHPSQKVALGQIVPVKILNIDHEGKKISLGMKQLEPDPWTGIAERYPAGTVLRGRVRNITNFGVFVEIEPGIDGLVHISDLSWTKKIKHPGEMIKKGQDLDVVILNIDAEARRISLGHKQIQTNPWNDLVDVYAEDTDHDVKVGQIAENGIYVELPLDVEAFVPANQLKNGPRNFQEFYRMGDTLNMRVIRFDLNKREIVMSEIARERAEENRAKAKEEREERAKRTEERRAIADFQKQEAASGPTTLGELSGLEGLRAQMAAQEAAEAAAEAEAATEAAAEAATAEAEVATAEADEAPAEETVAEAEADEAAADTESKEGES